MYLELDHDHTTHESSSCTNFATQAAQSKYIEDGVKICQLALYLLSSPEEMVVVQNQKKEKREPAKILNSRFLPPSSSV